MEKTVASVKEAIARNSHLPERKAASACELRLHSSATQISAAKTAAICFIHLPAHHGTMLALPNCDRFLAVMGDTFRNFAGWRNGR